MSEDHPRCPICRKKGDCQHLLLIIEESGAVGGGVLNDDVEALEEAFREIFEEVARRDAVCGSGLLLEATQAFFRGYGYIATTGELHAELDRNFAAEYLMDLLDRAPNLERTKCGEPPDAFEYVWSDSPEPARELITDRLRELRCLASLPRGAPQWTPAMLE